VEQVRDLFTSAEKAAIHGAALSNGAIAAFLGDLMAKPAGVPCVNIDSPKFAATLAGLVKASLITADRPAQIRA
jgi:NCAIR mutase (PurE)-related protein